MIEIDCRCDRFERHIAGDRMMLPKRCNPVGNARAGFGGHVHDPTLRDRVSKPFPSERDMEVAVESKEGLARAGVADDQTYLLVFEYAPDERAGIEPRVHVGEVNELDLVPALVMAIAGMPSLDRFIIGVSHHRRIPGRRGLRRPSRNALSTSLPGCRQGRRWS